MTPPIRVLFVCGRNQWRSPTAARIYAHDPRLDVGSAGLSPQSPRQLSARDLDWADLVLVMERRHLRRLRDRFRDHPLPEIAALDIPDEYQFMDPELIERLRPRSSPTSWTATMTPPTPDRPHDSAPPPPGREAMIVAAPIRWV